MDFEQAYAKFMNDHAESREGERKARLLNRNFHGEKLFLSNVWWPLRGSLDNMHPEFEITDWRGRSYFADFAWRSPWNVTILFEIKGYNAHVRDMDHKSFDNETNRELFLQGLGYRIASLSYNNVSQHPDLCLTLLRLFFSHFQSAEIPTSPSRFGETELIKFSFRLARPFRPIDVSRHMQISYRTTMRLIRQLLTKGWIVPVITGKGERIVSYKVVDWAVLYLD